MFFCAKRRTVFIRLMYDPEHARSRRRQLFSSRRWGGRGGGKGRRKRDTESTKKPSKLQTSWNNLSRQKERGQSKAGEASARNGPMKKDLCAAARQKKKKMLTLSERGPVAQRHKDKQSAVNPF